MVLQILVLVIVIDKGRFGIVVLIMTIMIHVVVIAVPNKGVISIIVIRIGLCLVMLR